MKKVSLQGHMVKLICKKTLGGLKNVPVLKECFSILGYAILRREAKTRKSFITVNVVGKYFCVGSRN
jgi:hypothetical protein